MSTTTAHPAFSSLFRALFPPHGHIYHCPRALDRPFDFLLHFRAEEELKTLSNPEPRATWLAGLVDSDRNVGIIHSSVYDRPRIAISSSSGPLVPGAARLMKLGGYHFDGPYRSIERGYPTRTFGITYTGDHWEMALQGNEEVRRRLASPETP